MIEDQQKAVNPDAVSRPGKSNIPTKVQRSLENFAHHKAWQVTGSDISSTASSTKSHESVFSTASHLWQKLHVRYI